MARPRRCWDDLPEDLAALIASRLPFFPDAVRMSAMCRSWRAGALQGLPRPHPPQLPWLLLPYRRVCEHPRRGVRVARFFCVADFLARRFKLPMDTGGARFFGSYPGGWIFIARGQSSGHILLNAHSHDRVELPDTTLPTAILPGPGAVLIQHRSTSRDLGVILLAATLSSSPVPRANCVAAAIVALVTPGFPRRIVIWRIGSQRISCCYDAKVDLEDVVFYNGQFHFITSGGHLLLVEPVFEEDGPLEQLQGVIQYHRFRGARFEYSHIKGRYLAVSRGELLMVVRLSLADQKLTSTFRVFQADFADGQWNELYGLDGRMIFVGRGSSRCYEAEHFGGWEGVYYHDECFGDVDMIHGVQEARRKYPSSDNGIWSGPPDNILTFVYRALAPSLYSCPVWFYP
ncbi:unnamed protein product [Urochloa decumbens]